MTAAIEKVRNCLDRTLQIIWTGSHVNRPSLQIQVNDASQRKQLKKMQGPV